jgi:hypothetical protein
VNAAGFLFDENMPHRVIRKLLQTQDASIQCWVIGEPGGPAIGSLDPELLTWIEDNDCVLVTRNHASMPVHLRNHLASGRHVPGILVMKTRLAPLADGSGVAADLGGQFPGEYHDQIVVRPR